MEGKTKFPLSPSLSSSLSLSKYCSGTPKLDEKIRAGIFPFFSPLFFFSFLTHLDDLLQKTLDSQL